jgi:diguanylate cyclase (GGDEF)-like protein/PAS domain S-box-containing protein
MHSEQIVILIPYILSAIISIATGLYVSRKGDNPGTRPFVVMALAEGGWTITYIMQLLSNQLAVKLYWNNMQFLGAVIVPLAYFLFSMEITGRKVQPGSLWRKILFGTGILIVVFIWTDGIHHLFRTDPRFMFGLPFTYMVFDDGPLFFLFTIYSYGLIGITCFLLAAGLIYSSRLYRFQIGTVLIGVMIPWLGAIFSNVNLIPFKLHDIVPLIFGLSNLIIAWALLKHKLFDILPMARNTIVEKMQDGVLLLDAQRRVVDYNQALGVIFNCPVAQAVGKPVNFLSEELAALDFNEIKQSQSKVEQVIHTPNGELNFEISVSRLKDSGGGKSILLLFRDETARKSMEEELKKSVSLMDATIQSTAEAILVLDSKQNIIAVNQQYLRLFHLPEKWAAIEDPQARFARVLSKVKEPKWYERRSNQLLEDLNYECTDKFEMADGRVIEREGRPYIVGNKTIGRLYTYMDITKRNKAEEKLEYFALTDPLTELSNRRNFFSVAQKEFERAVRYQHALSILLFDIDRFKSINDTYGHITGDRVLQTVGGFIKDHLREVDLIARFGGDEFVILLPESDSESALQTAERLRQSISELKIASNSEMISVTLSIGVASLDFEIDSMLDTVLDRADRGLNLAKQKGRNQVYVWKSPVDPL